MASESRLGGYGSLMRERQRGDGGGWEERDQVTRFKGFVFKTFIVKASVVESKMTENVVDELFVIWVKVHGIPAEAKTEDALRALIELVGDYKDIDGRSLKKDNLV
uniref:DUF4283 domain-containing protein n=1 Tax=Oryza glaberrima TaxID=4538 RepID=I1QZN8_ORYGL